MSNDADLEIAGLSLSVLGREFPDSASPEDLDWLTCRTVAIAGGARVETTGYFLRSTELAQFAAELKQLRKSLSGQAALVSLELNLSVLMSFVDTSGHLRATVCITPDHLTQRHEFRFELDQTHLPSIIDQLDAILVEFPAS